VGRASERQKASRLSLAFSHFPLLSRHVLCVSRQKLFPSFSLPLTQKTSSSGSLGCGMILGLVSQEGKHLMLFYGNFIAEDA
jgi:hypothetical protein